MIKKIETIALIGLGAMGCAYLSKIAETLPMDRIRVVASGPRAERYRRDGVTVNGVRILFPIFEPNSDVPPADLLIFTVKHNQLKQAILDARSQVGPDTVVISLLNGITSEIEIGEAYGKKKILLSLALGTDPVRTGDGTTFTTLGTIPFGEAVNREGTFSRNVLLIEDFFKRVGLRYDIPEDMTRALWKKFMMNVGVNQVTALLRCRYGAMQRAGLARDLAVAAMTEVVSIAERENVNLPEGEIEDALKILATLSPEGKTSTLQDVEAHRQTEAGIFGGTVTNLGRRHGVPVPVNEMLFKLIKATEEAYPYSIHP